MNLFLLSRSPITGTAWGDGGQMKKTRNEVHLVSKFPSYLVVTHVDLIAYDGNSLKVLMQSQRLSLDKPWANTLVWLWRLYTLHRTMLLPVTMPDLDNSTSGMPFKMQCSRCRHYIKYKGFFLSLCNLFKLITVYVFFFQMKAAHLQYLVQGDQCAQHWSSLQLQRAVWIGLIILSGCATK